MKTRFALGPQRPVRGKEENGGTGGDPRVGRHFLGAAPTVEKTNSRATTPENHASRGSYADTMPPPPVAPEILIWDLRHLTGIVQPKVNDIFSIEREPRPRNGSARLVSATNNRSSPKETRRTSVSQTGKPKGIGFGGPRAEVLGAGFFFLRSFRQRFSFCAN